MILSIITVNLNNKAGLLKTVESVVSQTFTGYEHILIDGVSTDGSLEVLHTYNKHFSAAIVEKDRGIYDAMNKGIAKAKGKYLLFLNSGDYFPENTTLESLDLINFYGDILLGLIQYENGSVVDKTWFINNKYGFLLKYTLPHQGTIVKADLFKRYGMYNIYFRFRSDYHWFVRVIQKNTKFIITKNIIALLQPDGVSTLKQDSVIYKIETLIIRLIHRIRKYQQWI
jgi:glycosyltransferase involved in cell wall biosynthesis